MDYLLQFQINLFALASLSVLFYTIHKKTQKFNYARQLFMYLIILTALALIIEPMTWIFDGEMFIGAYFLEYATNFLLVLLAPMIAGLIISYVDFKLFSSKKRLQKRFHYQQATVFTLVLLIINFFTPILFGVSTVNNHYHTGDYRWISYLIIFVFYLYMLYMILSNRHKTNRITKHIFLLFFFLPVLGMIVQGFESKLYLAWTSIVISLYMVYIFLESSTGDVDYLTKLYTRYSYRMYVRHIIEEQQPFGILFIDLNGFKAINDQYGHQFGDEILTEFGIILKKAFHQHKMISRIGGDEFIVVLEGHEDLLDKHIKTTYELLKHSHLNIMKDLKFSYGYQKHEPMMTSDVLFAKADEKMYIHKSASTT
ncbi:MAG: GGDEF domain-containing protein [Acholeplasmataceae bacterium]